MRSTGVYPIIIDIRKEVMPMDDFSKELAIAVVSSLVTVVTEQAIEAITKALKRKISRKAGKHAKRS